MSELAERALKIALVAEELANELRTQDNTTLEGEFKVIDNEYPQVFTITNEYFTLSSRKL